MTATLEITCGPPDANGKRTITATLGKRRHRDKFDIDDSFKRTKFREKAISEFGLDESAHEFLETLISAAADAGAGSELLFKPVITMLDTVAPQKVEWLWPKRIAVGKNNLLCGDPGLGKSLLALDVAARVSRGDYFPDCRDIEQQPGGVVILTLEDDAADTLVPRLIAHDADLSRIAHVQGLADFDGDGEVIRGIDLLHDVGAVRAAIEQVKNCKLLVIDTVSDYFGQDTDAHKNTDVRAVLNLMAALANECRVANLLISHLRKTEGRAIHAAMGSVGIPGQCRVSWLVTRCPTDPRRRLLTYMKNNLADDNTGLAFAIQPYGPDGGPVLCWETEPVRMSADEALAATHKKRGPTPKDREDAATWLQQQLANGPKPAGDILDDAEVDGHKPWTVRRAFKQLDCHRRKDGFNEGWIWSLPEVDNEVNSEAHTQEMCNLRNLRENKREEDSKNCSRAKVTGSQDVVPTDEYHWGPNGHHDRLHR